MTKAQNQPHMAVLGGGAWGTALACYWHKNMPVTLWANEAATVSAINQTRENTQFLPGIDLPEAIQATENLADLAAADIILMVVPAQFARPVLTELRQHNSQAMLVLCAKGIERGSLKLMSDVAAEIWPSEQIAVLSGPSVAADVARGLPTAYFGGLDDSLGDYLARHIGTAHFRPYLSDDIIGAEIGGAIKNVLAIACGIVAERAGRKRPRRGDGARLCRNEPLGGRIGHKAKPWAACRAWAI